MRIPGFSIRGDIHSESRVSKRRSAILVTGVSGSGKTTLVRSRVFPRVAAAISFADLMDELLDGTESKSLDSLWPATRARLQFEAAQRLIDYEPARQLVIDGHLIVPTQWGYTRGVPPAVWRVLRLAAIVIIHVPEDELVERIFGPVAVSGNGSMGSGNDASRLAELERTRVLTSLMHATIASYAMSTETAPETDNVDAAEPGCPVTVIINSKGCQEEAALQLARVISEYSVNGS